MPSAVMGDGLFVVRCHLIQFNGARDLRLKPPIMEGMATGGVGRGDGRPAVGRQRRRHLGGGLIKGWIGRG